MPPGRAEWPASQLISKRLPSLTHSGGPCTDSKTKAEAVIGRSRGSGCSGGGGRSAGAAGRAVATSGAAGRCAVEGDAGDLWHMRRDEHQILGRLWRTLLLRDCELPQAGIAVTGGIVSDRGQTSCCPVCRRNTCTWRVPFWTATARPPGDVRVPMLAGTVPLKSAARCLMRQGWLMPSNQLCQC